MNAPQRIPVHEIPADTLFRFYVSNGKESRAVLWFKCSKNGDLVTKQGAKAPKVLRTRGRFIDGKFVTTDQIEELGVSGTDDRAHPHLTFHPSGPNHPEPIVWGPGRTSHIPRFDLRHLSGLQEVVKHILATPEAYPVENPGKRDQYYAIIKGAYSATQTSELTFFVAPFDSSAGSIPDDLIRPSAIAHVVCTHKALPHSVLIQVEHALVDWPSTGKIHVMAIPEN